MFYEKMLPRQLISYQGVVEVLRINLKLEKVAKKLLKSRKNVQKWIKKLRKTCYEQQIRFFESVIYYNYQKIQNHGITMRYDLRSHTLPWLFYCVFIGEEKEYFLSPLYKVFAGSRGAFFKKLPLRSLFCFYQ